MQSRHTACFHSPGGDKNANLIGDKEIN